MAVPGRHNVANALAAAAAAYAAGLPVAMIAARLADVKPAGGRLRPVSLAGGIVLIDDSYNANPASVKAAVDVLAARAGRRVLVLGAMAELGPQSEALHAEVGRYAADQGIDVLWATGSHCRSAVDAFGEDGRFFEDREALIAELRLFLAAGDAVLVKGSRSAGMDAVVAALSNDASANQGKS